MVTDLDIDVSAGNHPVVLVVMAIVARRNRYWWLRAVGLSIFIGLVVVVTPVAAETSSSANPICNAAKLPGIIEGFFQLTTAIGIMGLVLVWQVDTVIEMFKPAPEQREAVRRHKRTAAKSAGIVTALGPMYTVAGSIMGLPLATCVNLAPW